MKKIILLLVASMTLTACSNGSGEFAPDTFSAADMCVVKVGNEEEKICYGMERSEVETLLGKVEEGNYGIHSYDFGVSLNYREDILVAIRLSDESKGLFQTARGSEVGNSKSEIIDLYGKKHPWTEHKKNLEYVYDMKTEKFVDRKAGEKNVEEDTYQFSAMFNDDGEATSIMLLDRKMAMTLQ